MTMFSMAGTSPDRTLSIIYGTGDTATIPETHTRFDELVALLLSGAGDDEVSELVDIMLAVSKKLVQLSERVSIRGRTILFDGDPLRGELAEVLADLNESGNVESLRPVVNFLEKAATNPSGKSIDELYRWITKGDLIIHEDGDFLAYKGVQVVDDERFSITAGKAFVNGEEITGYIPNPDGAVVTMPRSDVDDNMHEACSTGLHAGTYAYATKFLGWHYGDSVMMLVKINPRDVVSVPTDDLDQKLRVCRYVVQETVGSRREDRLYREEPSPVEETEEPALFEVVAVGFVNIDEDEPEDPEFEGFEQDYSGEEESDTEDEDAAAEGQEDLYSDELLEKLRQKLQGDEPDFQYSSLTEAEIEEKTSTEESLRDTKGRFTKDGASKAVRNDKGQFVRWS